MTRGGWLGALLALGTLACATPTPPPRVAPAPPTLALTPCHVPRSTIGARCGALEVFASTPFGEMLPADRIRACREALETVADLRLYTTSIAMADVDEVRVALGYSTINLYGVSYGSLAAMEYLRQHPAHVRSLALSGVATPAQKLPLQFAAGAQAALDRLLADCAADEPCRAAFPDLAGDVAAVVPRFDTGPVTFDLPRAGDETVERLSLSQALFAEHLRLMLYNLRSASRVPLILHRAAAGDWGPFARAASPRRALPPTLALGMYLSVTCSESIAVISEEEIVRAAQGSFVGEDRTRVHVRACQEWPRGSTPAHYATTLARTLPNARQILIRNAAHEYFADCLRDLVADFYARGSARGLDTRCVETLRRPPFVTRQPLRIGPWQARRPRLW